MSVDMAKKSDATPTFQPGLGAESGNGEIRFIGGFPTSKALPRGTSLTGTRRSVHGALVAVCGIRVEGHVIRQMDINGERGTGWITSGGMWIQVEEFRTVGDWFRFLLDSGTFAGVLFLR